MLFGFLNHEYVSCEYYKITKLVKVFGYHKLAVGFYLSSPNYSIPAI